MDLELLILVNVLLVFLDKFFSNYFRVPISPVGDFFHVLLRMLSISLKLVVIEPLGLPGPMSSVLLIEDMAAAYYQADLVVCRAGAMTVAEICAAGLAAILIPYPYAAGNHQKINAQYLVSKGAAIALEEGDLSANLLARTVKKFLDDRQQLLSIAQKARALGCPDAIGRVTRHCLEVVSA